MLIVAGGDNPGMGPYEPPPAPTNGVNCANAMMAWGGLGGLLGGFVGAAFGGAGAILGGGAGTAFGVGYGAKLNACKPV